MKKMYIHKNSIGKIQKIEFFKLYKEIGGVWIIKNILEEYEKNLKNKRHKQYVFRNFFKKTNNKTEHFCKTIKYGKYDLIIRGYSIKFKLNKNTPKNIELNKEEIKDKEWEDLKIEISYVPTKKTISEKLLINTIEKLFKEIEEKGKLTSLEAEKRCLNKDFKDILVYLKNGSLINRGEDKSKIVWHLIYILVNGVLNKLNKLNKYILKKIIKNKKKIYLFKKFYYFILKLGKKKRRLNTLKKVPP